MKTLRGSLLKTFLWGSLLTLLLLGLVVNFVAREEINELLDYKIQQVAFAAGGSDLTTLMETEIEPEGEFEEEPGLIIQIWDPVGKVLYGNTNKALPPRISTRGFGWTVDGAWRTFSYPDDNRWIQVSQSVRERRIAVLLVTLSLMGPILFFLVPALALVVILSVRKGLRPLSHLADILRDREPHSLVPLPEEGLPGEILPLIRELNGLLERLSGALDSKQMFLAHAAHELRTPVTAVRLQVQLALRATDTEGKDQALTDLGKGVQRISRLLDQLLTYSQLDPGSTEGPLRPISLGPLVREAITLLLPLARERNIDLGLTRNDPITVIGNPRNLLTMVTNLLDNALRYTPRDGKVDVSLTRGERGDRLEVIDSGPGIPPEEREKIFERFYRGKQRDIHGSGLGLSIVRQIAEQHGFPIELGEAQEGTGLKVTVMLPR